MSFDRQIAVKDNWNPENLSVVAFVYNDKDGVYQAAECKVVNRRPCCARLSRLGVSEVPPSAPVSSADIDSMSTSTTLWFAGVSAG